MRTAIYFDTAVLYRQLCLTLSFLAISTLLLSQTDDIDCQVECPDDTEISCTESTSPDYTGYPSITCYVPCDGGCTKTQGYWKTHSEYGPAPYDETWAMLEDGADTEFFETGESWHDIFWTPPAGGNAYLILAKQWMAAQLNVLAGASIPDDVLDAWEQGEQLLSDYDGIIYIPNGPDRAAAIEIAGMLDAYNNGDLGPGHCDDNDDDNDGDDNGEGSCEVDVEVDWSYSDSDSGDCPNVITRTWSGIVGDAEYTCTQTITVYDDEAPTLDNIPDDQNGLCDAPVEPAEVTASDNCDDDVDVTVSESIAGEGCDLMITFTYTATDDCGNQSQGSYTVAVQDDTAPELTGVPDDATVECDNVPDPADVSASDNCDPQVDVEYAEQSTPTDCGEVIVRTWTATDDCGNSTSDSQTLTVVDTTSPELFGVPEDTSLNCEDEIPDAIVWATDNCDDELVVTLTGETIPQECGYVLVRTWTTMDDCGNEASESQTITVVDVFNPTVTTPVEEEVWRDCDDDTPLDEPAFSDECDDELNIEYSEEILNDDGCEYDLQRNWVATDDCDNSTSVSQLVHFVDDEAPELSDYPEGGVVDCEDSLGEVPVLTATDNCDDDVEVVFEESIGDGEEMGCQLISPISPYYEPDWAVWLQELPEEYQYYQLIEGEGQWIEHPDGSVTIIATVVSTSNPNAGWYVEVQLGEGMDWTTWQSQPWPNWYKDDFNLAGDHYLDWIYYLIQEDVSFMSGWGDFEGSYLDLEHQPSNLYYGYQHGIAANNVNSEYGSGGWFGYSGVLMDSSTGYNEDVEALGDLAFNHDCCDLPPVTWTWTAEDCAGNSVSHSITFTFIGGGNTPPAIDPDLSQPCPGDFDGSQMVDSSDLLFLLSNLGCESSCDADMDGDDKTTIMDILLFLNKLGNVCN